MDHEKLLEFNKLVSQTSDFCCNKLKYSNYTMKFYHKCWDKIYELMLKHNISVIDDDSVSILIIATKIDKIELLVEYPNIINIMETTNKIISTF